LAFNIFFLLLFFPFHLSEADRVNQS